MRRSGRIVILGAGELASGVALRLHHCGFTILMTEIAEPRAVRRLVVFSEAVYDGECRVEGVRALRIDSIADSDRVLREGAIPIIVDPDGTAWREWKPEVLVDGRMKKGDHRLSRFDSNRLIGLGPGFTAGEDCHFVIETSRGHRLGRVIPEGMAAKNTGVPGELGGESVRRVLRSPSAGIFISDRSLGVSVRTGDEVGDRLGPAGSERYRRRSPWSDPSRNRGIEGGEDRGRRSPTGNPGAPGVGEGARRRRRGRRSDTPPMTKPYADSGYALGFRSINKPLS